MVTFCAAAISDDIEDEIHCPHDIQYQKVPLMNPLYIV